MNPKGKIKVLIVDDSEVVRSMLMEILSGDPVIRVIGAAADPYEAAKLMAEEAPDVITLDLEMPRMNGLTFLKKLMSQHPVPVVVVSSLTGERTDIGIRALSLGAAEIITKPKYSAVAEIEEYTIRLRDAVKAASMQNVFARRDLLKNIRQEEKLVASGIFPVSGNNKLILIGASTGGTELINRILKTVKPDLPPILIVQHMPGEFTTAFAKRLDSESRLKVVEAGPMIPLERGHAYIANGFYHLVVKMVANHYVCDVESGDLINRHRPSIDVLFRSVAKIAASNTMAVLLTGMGADGAQGLLELKNKGATCIAQDEKSCVVYGMPKEAARLNAADLIGDPEKIINWINNFA